MNRDALHDDRARAIALAGLFQAARLVQQTGRGQRRDTGATHAVVASIFNTDPADVMAVYGGAAALHNGLEVLNRQLGSNSGERDLELTAYAVTLLALERKLARDRRLLDRLAAGIGAIARPPADVLNETVITALAGLYQQTISTLTPRVMVRGEPEILASPEAQRMIRALLLGGMRAAVLWHQCGGNRLRLIFGRRTLRAAARALLQEATARS